MQEALPYKRWEALSSMASASPGTTLGGGGGDAAAAMGVESLVKENPVIVFGRRGCCMCHVVRKLLLGLGVNPPIFEVDGEVNEGVLVNSLLSKVDGVKNLQFPLVFVGGELFGGLEKIMATHLSGDLVPILKQAGALWL